IRESWKAALAQEALKPIADPHIHNLKWDAGTPVTFEFHVEVKPDITLERIGKFHLKRTVPKVTEDRVLAQLNELRDQKAPWTPRSRARWGTSSRSRRSARSCGRTSKRRPRARRTPRCAAT